MRASLTETKAFAKNNDPLPGTAGESIVVTDHEIPTFSSETVHDISFRARNVRTNSDTKNLVIDLCYDLLEPREWSIADSTLYDAKGASAQLRELALLDVFLPPVIVDGKPMQEVLNFRGAGEERYFIAAKENQEKGQICVTATYVPQSAFDTSNFHILVHALARSPYENEACEPAYQEQVQRTLDERKTGIKIKIEKEIWHDEESKDQATESEICRVAIAQKPDTLSVTQAMTLINEVHRVQGDWKIEVNAQD